MLKTKHVEAILHGLLVAEPESFVSIIRAFHNVFGYQEALKKDSGMKVTPDQQAGLVSCLSEILGVALDVQKINYHGDELLKSEPQEHLLATIKVGDYIQHVSGEIWKVIADRPEYGDYLAISKGSDPRITRVINKDNWKLLPKD